MACPRQKAFCVLEFAKTNTVVTVQHAFRREFDANPSSSKNENGGLNSFKRVGVCVKEKVEDDRDFRRNKWPESVLRLRGSTEVHKSSLPWACNLSLHYLACAKKTSVFETLQASHRSGTY